jgi:hypothetical protein
MKKLLKLLDDNLLRFGVAFAILFTAWYPKLPSVHVERTWVYIRLEDFVILSLAVIWLIQLLRKKVSLPKPEGLALVLYWVGGLLSLLYCLAFVAPHLQNFFPMIAGFQYARRIEYMILFFVAFSSVRSMKDIYFYLTTLCITVLGVAAYGFGQKFYLMLWSTFPDFFKANPFCFPAFLTGNEEFAKGVPLCLTDTSRTSSTFGGHYDLSAYLVFVIPILIALFFAVKRWSLRIGLFILSILALDVLNFTSSRTSFAAYIIGVVAMFVFWKRKLWIVPVLIVSIGAMFISSDATMKRFAKTIQPVQVVSVNKELPSDLKAIIAKTKQTEENKKPEVPPASDFTVGNNNAVASQSAGYTTVLTDEQLRQLKMTDVAISTVSGSFLIQKAYALDISFTTRFQAEWPRNWAAFNYSPVFGTGYSSLTLATDNDYLRAIGETGLVGLLTFLFIFVVLGIFMKKTVEHDKDPIIRALLFGLAGGMVGLLVNAVLIDVFEASKVAEPLWILLGIGVGAGYLHKKQAINYKDELIKFFTSPAMIIVYLLVVILTAFAGSLGNYFVADDFTWLRWAATSGWSDVPKYFFSAQDFFYRPLDKTIVYVLFLLFSFEPPGYHLFTLLIHFITVVGVYFLSRKLLNNKLLGFLAAVLFALHPVHHENIFWFSTISVTLSSLFIVYTVLAHLKYRETNSKFFYYLSIILTVFGLLAYEMAVITPFLLVAVDLFVVRVKRDKKLFPTYLPYLIVIALYFIIRHFAHAFAGGGDYSYNLVKLPFNFIGNYFGYLLLFLGGNNALGFYTLIRDSFRTQPLMVVGILLLIVIIAGVLFNTFRKYLRRFVKNQTFLLVCFGLVFAFISLLPFLGLGNIAPRYFYLASFGFIISFMAFAQFAATKLPHRIRKYTKVYLIILVTVLSLWYVQENKLMSNEWQNAGTISKQTLKVFRVNYESLSQDTQVYFAGAPLKYLNAWLFPVNLRDALWVIYRDTLPQVHMVGTVEEAQKQILQNKTKENFIFRFDDNGRVIRVQ